MLSPRREWQQSALLYRETGQLCIDELVNGDFGKSVTTASIDSNLYSDMCSECNRGRDADLDTSEKVDAVGHVHLGDVLGRHESGTGDPDYRNALGALADTWCDGYVGCELFPEGDATDAVAGVVEMAVDDR